MARNTITVRVLGDTSHFERAVGQVEGKLQGFGSSVGRIAAGIGAAFGGIAIGGALKDTISAASDLNESMSKANVVFGKSVEAVNKFASTSARSLGISKRAAFEATGTFGNLFRTIGLNQSTAAGFSTNIVKLGADLASFNNIGIDDALEKLRSGLSGEAEPLRSLGVFLNESSVKAEAMRLGLVGANGELSEAAKVQARYSLIMKQTATAQGDFARTSNGLANRQRILAARFDDLKTSLGQKLLPVAVKVAEVMDRRVLPALANIGQVAGRAVAAIRQIVGVLFQGDFKGGGPFEEDAPFIVSLFRVRDIFIRDVLPAMRQVFGFLERNAKPILIGVAAAFVAITSPALALIAGFALLYTRSEAFRTSVNAVAATVADFASAVADQFGNVVAYVERTWPQISEAVGHVMVVISEITSVVLAAVQKVWHLVGDDLLKYVGAVFNLIRGVIEGALTVVRGVIQTVLALINGDWRRAWDGLKQIVSGLFTILTSIVSGGLASIRALLGGLASIILGVAGAVLDAAKAVGRKIVDGIVAGIKAAPKALIDALESLIPGGGLIGGAIDKVGGLFGKLPGFDHGGIVPGPVGKARLAIVHGGETVLPTHRESAGGPTIIVNASTNASPEQIAAAVTSAQRLAALTGVG